MAGTIGPVVRGAGKTTAQGVIAFSTASILGGASTGVVAWVLLSRIGVRGLAEGTVAIGVATAISYLRFGKMYVPWPRQAPPRWIDPGRPLLSCARFGYVMGVGFGTPLRAGSLLSLMLLAARLHSLPLAVLSLGLMGLFRALPVAVVSLFFREREGTGEVAESLARFYGRMKILDVAAVTVAVAACA